MKANFQNLCFISLLVDFALSTGSFLQENFKRNYIYGLIRPCVLKYLGALTEMFFNNTGNMQMSFL